MAGFDNIFEDANRKLHEERIVALEQTIALLVDRIEKLEAKESEAKPPAMERWARFTGMVGDD